MASAVAELFSTWLNEKLQELNTDETVFGSYITSIVEGDETTEEKVEALQGILAEIIEDSDDGDEITRTCNEILEKWQFHKPKEAPPSQISSEDVDSKLVKLLESQSLATTKPKKYTEEQKKIRDAILTQYSQMTDDEDEEENQAAGGGGGGGSSGGGSGPGDHKENGLEKNLNAQSVMHAEKVKREQARIDSQKKKDKDKEDREKQKQLREEKKEKRKTQKGERRR